MKNETNKSRYGVWGKVSGTLLLMVLTLIFLCPISVKAAITPSGTLSIGSNQMTADLYYQFKPTANGFYKLDNSESSNWVTIYTDEEGYYDDFKQSTTKFLRADTTYYFRCDVNTTVTIAVAQTPALEVGKTDQIMFSGNYYVIVPTKTSDYRLTFTSVATDGSSPWASIYDENDEWITGAKEEKDKPSVMDVVLKANKKYYLRGSNAKVSIQVGEIGNERDALASSIAATKAAIANGKAPAKVVVKSLKPGKKSLLVKWKKVKNISGYELEYATNKQFTVGGKLLKVKKSKISRKITKLTSKKKYFVRIRAYRNIKGGTVYGKWSKVKAKKVK